MKKIIIPIAFLLLVAVGCRHTPDNEVETKTYTLVDSMYFENEFDAGYSYYTINLDLPITNNDSLRMSILHWMLSPETEDYKAFVQEDRDGFFAEDGNEPHSALEENYTLSEQTDHYVTYTTEGYLYTGGAHPMPWYYGTTFSKIDGSIVGYDMFDDTISLKHIVTENIHKQYFDKYNTEEEEYFFEPEETFALPENEPWVETDSVVFCYGAYEIAPYAAGMPLCKISKEELQPYLSQKGKKLLGVE
ncbi:MAG: DUF3298 domain-containing protein [Bacteroidales bacterium]|nr:DUF3298 domain-containing protein [Bacteroidales bacterium]